MAPELRQAVYHGWTQKNARVKDIFKRPSSIIYSGLQRELKAITRTAGRLHRMVLKLLSWFKKLPRAKPEYSLMRSRQRKPES
jgi:hypothetical protein